MTISTKKHVSKAFTGATYTPNALTQPSSMDLNTYKVVDRVSSIGTYNGMDLRTLMSVPQLTYVNCDNPAGSYLALFDNQITTGLGFASSNDTAKDSLFTLIFDMGQIVNIRGFALYCTIKNIASQVCSINVSTSQDNVNYISQVTSGIGSTASPTPYDLIFSNQVARFIKITGSITHDGLHGQGVSMNFYEMLCIN